MSKPGIPASAIVGSSGASLLALRRGHGDRAHLAALDLRHRVGEVVEHELRVAGEQRLQRGRAALVGDVRDVGAGSHLEELAGEVPGRCRCLPEPKLTLPGFALAKAIISRHRVTGVAAVDDQHVGRDRDQADRGEILDRSVGHLRVQARVDGVRRQRAHHHRVAVRRRLGDGVGPDVAAGAGLVLHHDLLPPGFESFCARSRPTLSSEPPGGTAPPASPA